MRALNIAIVAGIGLTLSACGATTANRSVYSENQPVVERSHYVLDLNLAGGSLPAAEQRRLSGWFDAMDLGYGDRVSIDDPSYTASGEARAVVEAQAASYGLLVADIAPVTTGQVPVGAMRVVVSRSVATVPNCPNWSHRSHTDFQLRTSENYGCGVNSTMAAMIADPEDLVRGKAGTEEDQEQHSKAIRAYRAKAKNAGGN